MPQLATEQHAALTYALEERLRMTLMAYFTLKTQRDALDDALELRKKDIGDTLTEASTNSATVDGMTATRVQGTYTKLDERKLIALLNCSVAQLEACRVTFPKKPYLDIRQQRGDQGAASDATGEP